MPFMPPWNCWAKSRREWLENCQERREAETGAQEGVKIQQRGWAQQKGHRQDEKNSGAGGKWRNITDVEKVTSWLNANVEFRSSLHGHSGQLESNVLIIIFLFCCCYWFLLISKVNWVNLNLKPFGFWGSFFKKKVRYNYSAAVAKALSYFYTYTDKGYCYDSVHTKGKVKKKKRVLCPPYKMMTKIATNRMLLATEEFQAKQLHL